MAYRGKGYNGKKNFHKGKRGTKQSSPSQRDDAKMNRNDSSHTCDESKRTSGLNDLSWYTRNPLLVDAAGRFPYPYKPGMQYSLVLNNIKANNLGVEFDPGISETFTQVVPGILSLDWMPTIGRCLDATDPANIVAKEMYARVRNAYSGTLEADPADLMIYLLALDSFFTYIGWLKRIYRTVSLYSSENFLFPDTMMQAFGFSPEQSYELRSNKTELWQRINELVYMSRKLTCPAVMDYFNRHYWMSDNVYTDAFSPKAQFYVFNLRAVYQYKLNTDKSGMLQAVTVPHNKASGKSLTQTLYDFGVSLFTPLQNDETSYIINGYFQRAYEGVPNFVVQTLEQGETLSPVYVEEVLTQIENSRTLFGLTDAEVNDDALFGTLGEFMSITQNPANGQLICKPMWAVESITSEQFTGFPGLLQQGVLTARSDMPSVAENVIMTRLQAIPLDLNNSESGLAVQAFGVEFTCGSEVPIAWKFTSLKPDGSTYQSGVINFISNFSVTGPSQAGAASYWADLLTKLRISAFDWHPLFWVSVLSNTGAAVSAELIPLGDIHNFTVVSGTSIYELHKVCLYSEFNAFGQA